MRAPSRRWCRWSSGALVATPGRLGGVQDLGRGAALQDRGHLSGLLCVDPSHDVGHGAAVERRGGEEGRQELGRRGVPELTVSGRPFALGRFTQLGGGPARLPPLVHNRSKATRLLARAPVEPVGSMHHTWPWRARVPNVLRRRSLFTLAASTGPRQPRIAGTARLVVFPLWVGPITTRDCAVSAASPVSRATPGNTPRRRRPGGSALGRHPQRPRSRRLAQRAPGAAHRVGGPSHALVAPCQDTPCQTHRQRARRRVPAAGRRRAGSPPPYPAAMAESVSTIARSIALRRCCTRKERCPTFHNAMPRRSCGSRSASVTDSERSSAAASISPGDCA